MQRRVVITGIGSLNACGNDAEAIWSSCREGRCNDRVVRVMTMQGSKDGAEVAARTEQRWATISVIIVIVVTLLAAIAGIHQATMPQARVETADPSRLHVSGEFVESNLGSVLEPDGTVMVRAIGQQYSFTPACILVPAQTPITLRATSADVVHGILVQATNINTMLVPGSTQGLAPRSPGRRGVLGCRSCGHSRYCRGSPSADGHSWPRPPGRQQRNPQRLGLGRSPRLTPGCRTAPGIGGDLDSAWGRS